MFRGKPRTIGELYENIMKKETRKLETGRPTYHFYITPYLSYENPWTEVTDKNIKQYKNLTAIGKFHDDWDEYVCFQIDISKEKNNVQTNDNKRKRQRSGVQHKT